jgi:hypothetical protein
VQKAFYVDLKRDSRFALLAGPFPDEATARKYERAAFDKANKVDPWAAFDSYGVLSINDHMKPGKLNHLLDIDPADLLQVPAKEEA